MEFKQEETDVEGLRRRGEERWWWLSAVGQEEKQEQKEEEEGEEHTHEGSDKYGLAFILNERSHGHSQRQQLHEEEEKTDGSAEARAQPLWTTAHAAVGEARSTPRARGLNRPRSASPSSASLDKKRGRMCKFDGCTNYIVHKGLCCRHGGGKKCSVEGCETSAKHGGLCWRHGGSVECKVPDCTKKAKAKGLCWAHGGGTKCTQDGCEKVAVSNGFCWAHGGGKRCIYDGCNKPAYERTHNFCVKHYNELQGVDYFEV